MLVQDHPGEQGKNMTLRTDPSVSRRRLSLLAAVLCLISIPLAGGQQKPARLTFEVAAIRTAQPGATSGGIKPTPGGNGYLVQNMPVKIMISLMYKVPARQITGGPDWIESDRYDIEAKADRAYSIDDLHVMFQNLLADRFNLKFHKDIREGPVYALMVDKSGLKMKVNESDQDFKIPITPGADNVAVGKRVPMQYLCWWLGGQLQSDQRPVINKTGLDKNYDFTLSFAPELPPNFPKENLPPGLLDRPSLFDALKEQLGLKLEAEKGPVEYYVIDHVEKPSAN
jgi:uncharacterized protein (TIGR03435 family)